MTSPSILSAIDWRGVGRVAQREQSNRERYTPVVSSYRWWARRPHSVMGAILDAAQGIYGDHFIVADPFSGGGTVTVEAVRRGLTAYAQDLYPWVAEGLATALTRTSSQEFKAAADMLLASLGHHRTKYRTAEGGELTHVLRVRIGCCPNCRSDVHLFPEYLVTRASRGVCECQAYFGCTACGGVTLAKAGVKTFRCKACGKCHDTSRTTSQCPHCTTEFETAPVSDGAPRWKTVLVQHVVMEGAQARARLRAVLPGDPVDEPDASAAHSALAVAIPDGIETKRLGRMGFVRWGDLYTRRQVEILLDAFATIRGLPHSKAVKDRLAFAVIGCAEMPAFLSRWDRAALKPFEALANHRYAHTTLAVEMNPLAPVGRGTLAKRLASAKRSLGWLSRECGKLPKVKRVLATDTRVLPKAGRVVIATGSSKAQPIPSDTVQLVLSDPPYLDDVQYGELARLFHLWLSVYTPIAPADESAEAVPNSTRGTDVDFYQHAIASCLAESQRTLASRGRLVLTFHNTKLVAWQALAGALHDSGFDVCAMAVVYAENGTDLCKRNVNSMLHDLVLECCARRRSPVDVQIAVTPKSVAEKSLVAVGLALAEATRSGNAGELPALYGSQLKRLGTTKKTIR
jgi:putative DNA methylase